MEIPSTQGGNINGHPHQMSHDGAAERQPHTSGLLLEDIDVLMLQWSLVTLILEYLAL